MNTFLSGPNGCVQKRFDLLVFIGRFQPLHLGHQRVIDTAIRMSKKVLVIVGGAGKARSARNPLTYDERESIIREAYPDIEIRPMADYTYRDAIWLENVHKTIKEVALGKGWSALGMNDLKIGLIGCQKDASSYYLKLFPEFESVGVEFANPINATDIRERFYEEDFDPANFIASFPELDPRLVELIFNMPWHVGYKDYWKELDYIDQWGEGPHLCSDALVRVGNKVLLVTRKDNGKLALPGGHLNKREKFRNAAIRELREETRLKVPEPVLRGSIVSSRIFDDPYRSSRGWVITECTYINLVNETSLPEVRGTDDAKHAGWYDISDLTEAMLHDDHFHIIKAMI